MVDIKSYFLCMYTVPSEVLAPLNVAAMKNRTNIFHHVNLFVNFPLLYIQENYVSAVS